MQASTTVQGVISIIATEYSRGELKDGELHGYEQIQSDSNYLQKGEPATPVRSAELPNPIELSHQVPSSTGISSSAESGDTSRVPRMHRFQTAVLSQNTIKEDALILGHALI